MTGFSSEELAKREYFLKPLNSPEELKNWIYVYLDIILPFGNISGFTEDPNSDIIYASPGEAIWIAYNTYKEDRYKENPGYIWLGSRDSAKTLAGSILNVLLLAHFKAEIAHLAAVRKQAEKCIEYTNTFMRKIRPYLEYHGRKVTGDSKTKIQVLNEDESVSYIDVVVANLAGGNSQRSTVGTYDELDTLSKEGYKGYKESLLIPTRKNNKGPLRIKYSTRKFSFGVFEKEIQERHKTKEKLVQWNILDIAERCPDERSLESAGEKHVRFVKRKLPLRVYTEDEVNQMPETEKLEVKAVSLHKGCLTCPIASICQGHLTKRRDDERAGMNSVYKDIDFVIGRFNDISEEMAEAQLLCFSENTNISVEGGIQKPIKEIKIGERVLTHTGQYKKVIEVMSREYSGEAFLIDSFPINTQEKSYATIEHPFFVNGNQWKSATDILNWSFAANGKLKTKGDYFSLPIFFENKNINEIKISDFVKNLNYLNNKVRAKKSNGLWVGDTIKLDFNFGWVLGYYLAEGHLYKRSYSAAKDSPRGIFFSSADWEFEYHKKVADFAQSMGAKASFFHSKIGRGYSVRIYNQILGLLFKELCGEKADKKRIHPKLMVSNLELLRGILYGFYCGDGTKRKEAGVELTTTSRHLASQLFHIASFLGLCPRIKAKRAHNKDGKKPYRVIYNNPDYEYKQKRTKFIANQSYNLYRLPLQKEYFSGRVYNLEVEGDHSYIANGVAAHNCWKPTSVGVIYSRFSDALGDNVLTIDQAYELATGEKVTNCSLEDFVNALHNIDAEVYAGVDFGFTNHSVIVILARISTGYSFILDTYSMPGLETHDFAEVALQYQEKYKVKKWFCDNAAPAAIKTFQKKGLRCSDFKKDIQGGIDAIRSQIITPKGVRLLKVVKTKENDQILTMFKEHHFLLDIAGNVTKNPDDTAGVADIGDALRYIGQNIFQAKRGQGSILVATENTFTQKIAEVIDSNNELKDKAREVNKLLMSNEIAKRAETSTIDPKDNTIKKNKKIFWSMD